MSKTLLIALAALNLTACASLEGTVTAYNTAQSLGTVTGTRLAAELMQSGGWRD